MLRLTLSVCLAAALGFNVLPNAVSAQLQAAEASLTPVPASGGTATLSPQNTHLKFVCAHRGPKPDPRTGTFSKFTGTAKVDASAKKLESLSLDIDATSVATEFGKLTSHLQGPDFFDTREHPKASFVSKKVTAGPKDGEVTIVGDLTLHGETKEIKAPATVEFTDKGFTLSSSFAIDRSEFGMKYGSDKIENTVALTFVIGEPNKALAEGGK